MTIVWRHAALTSAHRFMADQAGMRQVNRAIAALAEDSVSLSPGVVRDILVKQVGLSHDEALKVVR